MHCRIGNICMQARCSCSLDAPAAHIIGKDWLSCRPHQEAVQNITCKAATKRVCRNRAGDGPQVFRADLAIHPGAGRSIAGLAKSLREHGRRQARPSVAPQP